MLAALIGQRCGEGRRRHLQLGGQLQRICAQQRRRRIAVRERAGPGHSTGSDRTRLWAEAHHDAARAPGPHRGPDARHWRHLDDVVVDHDDPMRGDARRTRECPRAVCEGHDRRVAGTVDSRRFGRGCHGWHRGHPDDHTARGPADVDDDVRRVFGNNDDRGSTVVIAPADEHPSEHGGHGRRREAGARRADRSPILTTVSRSNAAHVTASVLGIGGLLAANVTVASSKSDIGNCP
jgi:hypothetical protein